MIKIAKNLLIKAGRLVTSYIRRVIALLFLSINPRQKTVHLSNQKRKSESEELEKSKLVNSKLVSNKVSSELYIDVELDELSGIVYLMLNRTSFAITLEEFAELSSSVSEAYITLIEHPNIILTSSQDEITKEDTEEFMYLPSNKDDFVN